MAIHFYWQVQSLKIRAMYSVQGAFLSFCPLLLFSVKKIAKLALIVGHPVDRIPLSVIRTDGLNSRIIFYRAFITFLLSAWFSSISTSLLSLTYGFDTTQIWVSSIDFISLSSPWKKNHLQHLNVDSSMLTNDDPFVQPINQGVRSLLLFYEWKELKVT